MAIVEILLLPHVVAGGLSIVSGFIALAAAKGAKAHRSSGMLFVCAMLMLSSTGAVMALTVRPNAGNAMAGVLTFYLLPVPVFVPLVAMVFWLWLVRARGTALTPSLASKERTS